ncbi:MAG: TspO/MBR family protein [Pyrinomonadaceae bacterium]
MSITTAVLISLGICLVAAVLEGLCAGKNVKSYFATLQFPPYAAPLGVWYGIGFVYYAIFFALIFRILRHEGDFGLRVGTLSLIIFMMAVNALWNYVFFRARNLFISFVAASLFPVLDIALLLCLIRFDSVAAWALVPYLLYRLYAVWWGYALWKMNRRRT